MVKERFFNIWYLMRYGRKKNKSQVLCLVRFLDEWCSKDELEDRNKKENTHIIIVSLSLLHNDDFLESVTMIKKVFNDVNNILYKDILIYFINLLAKKQYHLTYKLFEESPQLKEQYKPIYYTIMIYLKDEYPKEYLKMGSELEETVKEIEEKILKVREFRA